MTETQFILVSVLHAVTGTESVAHTRVRAHSRPDSRTRCSWVSMSHPGHDVYRHAHTSQPPTQTRNTGIVHTPTHVHTLYTHTIALTRTHSKSLNSCLSNLLNLAHPQNAPLPCSPLNTEPSLRPSFLVTPSWQLSRGVRGVRLAEQDKEQSWKESREWRAQYFTGDRNL